MPSNMFAMQRFVIMQDHCAMKVTQDACILGGIAPLASARSILDIGTGTGLLALMAAQRAPQARVVAVEVVAEAAHQAASNVAASPFSTVTVVHSSIQDFCNGTSERFHHIICNPPFHQEQPRSADAGRRAAWHAEHLDFDDLAGAIATLLTDDGLATLLCPTNEWERLVQACTARGLHATERIDVRDRPDRPFRRVISVWGKQPATLLQRTFTARSSPTVYSDDMRLIMGNFYLLSSLRST